MKFTNCKVKNFASYKDLEFNYDNLGLVAITGETGSGKSTLLDIIPWILFGETSKDTKADDIRSWTCEEPTYGELEVETENLGIVRINRIRGNASENDLYITYNSNLDNKIRGKSIHETQDIIETILNVTSDLYFTSAYLHQFSKADTFFLSRSSERRDLFEKVVDQSKAIQLTNNVSKERKELKQKIESHERMLIQHNARLRTLNEMLQDSYGSHERWSVEQADKHQELFTKSEDFQENKEHKLLELNSSIIQHFLKVIDTDAIHKISKIENECYSVEHETNNLLNVLKDLNELNDPVCPTCHNEIDGSHLENEKIKTSNSIAANEQDYIKLKTVLSELRKDVELLQRIDVIQKDIEHLEQVENVYLPQLEDLKNQVNPFDAQIAATKLKTRLIEEATHAEEHKQVSDNQRLSLLDLLYDLTFDLRGAILLQAVQEIESKTNEVLNKYFDSEILVKFTLESSDKLELEMQKSGNVCTFKQLSGGQRCMLKLAFNLSLMKLAENKAGVKFNTLALDEPLTGLSDDLKIKAFSLFESLTNDYDTIMIVEHSDALKACFNNTIVVQLESDQSKISYS